MMIANFHHRLYNEFKNIKKNLQIEVKSYFKINGDKIEQVLQNIRQITKKSFQTIQIVVGTKSSYASNYETFLHCYNAILICIYIPPSTSIVCNSDLFVAISTFMIEKLLICRNFNILDGLHTNAINTTSLQNFLNFAELKQDNKIANQNKRLFDLIITSSCNNCCTIGDIETLVPEDLYNPALLIDVSQVSTCSETTVPIDCCRLISKNIILLKSIIFLYIPICLMSSGIICM